MDKFDPKIINWIRLGALMFVAMSLLSQPSVKLDGFKEVTGTFYGQF
jgi:hypothetical protein